MLVRFEFPWGETAADEPPNGIGESLYKIRTVREELTQKFTEKFNSHSPNFHG